MSYRFSERSLATLATVHSELREVVRQALALSPVDFVVIEGRRTARRQAELVKSGASQTMESRHLAGPDGLGRAVDLAAWVGEIRWDMGLYYQIAAAMQKAAKLTAIPVRWGGAWLRLDTTDLTPAQMVAEYVASRRAAGRKAFIDSAHFELLKGARYP